MLEYEFLQADNLSQAVDYLDKYKKVKIISGGTDILVEMHKKELDNEKIDYLLDISNIDELKEIKEKQDYIELCAGVTHSDIMESELLNGVYSVLGQAAETIGSTQIRNRGTVGGNIVNASPAADLVSPLIALRVELVLNSKNNERIMKIPEFITWPYQTNIREDEILTKIRIPKLDGKYYSNFQKIKRRKAVDIARLNTAVLTKIDSENRFRDISIVPGSATPTPQAFSEVEKMVEGSSIDEINLEDIGKKAEEEMVSITGERWSTPYKKPAIATIVRRALEVIIKEVKTNE